MSQGLVINIFTSYIYHAETFVCIRIYVPKSLTPYTVLIRVLDNITDIVYETSTSQGKEYVKTLFTEWKVDIQVHCR